MDKLLDFIRGVVRPTTTWLGFFALVLMIFLKLQVPDWFQVMVASMIAYWYGSRNSNGHPV